MVEIYGQVFITRSCGHQEQWQGVCRKCVALAAGTACSAFGCSPDGELNVARQLHACECATVDPDNPNSPPYLFIEGA